MQKFKHGDRVSWFYTHHYNSKSSARRRKEGEYIGMIRHTVKHKGKQLAAVQFDGNKRMSKVSIDKLTKINK